MNEINRRQVFLAGGASCVALVAAPLVAAVNTKAPPEPAPDWVSPTGRFFGKVVLKVAALEYARDNIRICAISPGGGDTPMLRTVREQRGMSSEQGSKAIPIPRANTVEEILASKQV